MGWATKKGPQDGEIAVHELTVALAKGRVARSVLPMFEEIGCDVAQLGEALDAGSRSLTPRDGRRGLTFLLAKADDVPTYVEYGAADLGVVGKDVLMEADRKVAELLDLGVAACRFVVAVPAASRARSVQELDDRCRVASKYPQVARRYFASQGLQVEVVPLHGSVELAPLVGLAEAVVDITETGRTLEENGLEVIAEIAPSTVRLIANRIRLKVEHERIRSLVGDLERAARQLGAVSP